MSDLEPSLFAKFTRKGELVWQFGGDNPKDPSKFFQGVPTWMRNHGHHLLADGTFVFFNNGQGMARVFKLDTSNMTATDLLSYGARISPTGILGDAQRQPGGNLLVTFSEGGQIHEVDPSGRLVAVFKIAGSFGYAEFRETLYGPPSY